MGALYRFADAHFRYFWLHKKIVDFEMPSGLLASKGLQRNVDLNIAYPYNAIYYRAAPAYFIKTHVKQGASRIYGLQDELAAIVLRKQVSPLIAI